MDLEKLEGISNSELYQIKKQINLILKKRYESRSEKVKERRKDIFYRLLNGEKIVTLAKEYNLTPATIKYDFDYSLHHCCKDKGYEILYKLNLKTWGAVSYYRKHREALNREYRKIF